MLKNRNSNQLDGMQVQIQIIRQIEFQQHNSQVMYLNQINVRLDHFTNQTIKIIIKE